MSFIKDYQKVYVNSKNRIDGNDGNYTYNIQLKPDNKFDQVCLLNASIPKSYFNIENGYNYFTVKELDKSFQVIITAGNFTRNSLGVSLPILLNNASITYGYGWTYSCSFPNNNTTVDTGVFNYSVVGGNPKFIYDDITDANKLMGFANNSTNTFVNGLLSSTQVINLQPIQTIQLHCSFVNNRFGTNLTSADILQTFPVNSGYPSFANIGYLCPDVEAYSHELSSKTLGSCNIYFTDQDLIPIDFNNVNNQFELLFYEKNKEDFHLKEFLAHYIETSNSTKV